MFTHAQRKWLALQPREVREKARLEELEKTREKRQRTTRPDTARGERERKQRLENVAIFDTETSPFDNTRPDEQILPFLGVVYTPHREPLIIWEEDFPAFVLACLAAFDSLPGKWTIYAHNGGRFDWMYFLSEVRGKVTFKGRGLMTAKLGRHELRDSFHILPVKLAALQKDEIDYQWMRPENRHAHRQEIIDYCISDCRYLYRNVIAFLEQHGFVLTIGQASMKALKSVYEFDRYNDRLDANIRRFYLGGRVECLQGAGRFDGEYQLYDLNSAYPDAMAHCKHPHRTDEINWREDEPPNSDTFFVRMRCKNRGALIQPPDFALTSRKIIDIANSVHPGAHTTEGEYCTTIWEHNTALDLGLITDVEYLECIDFPSSTDFSEFILPLYGKRELCKETLERPALAGDNSDELRREHAKRDSLFYKLLQNNAYGKFAQNPRDFKEKIILDAGVRPQEYQDWLDHKREDAVWEETEYKRDGKHLFSMWERAAPEFRFNNVAIAASITGRVRATLMHAIANAEDAIYCDTDCVIAKRLSNVEFSQTKLGAWNHEATFDQIIIAGKKTYAARNTVTGKKKFASKGAFGLQWEDYERMISGKSVLSTAFGVTLNKNGTQQYLRKSIRQTAPKRRAPDHAKSFRTADFTLDAQACAGG